MQRLKPLDWSYCCLAILEIKTKKSERLTLSLFKIMIFHLSQICGINLDFLRYCIKILLMLMTETLVPPNLNFVPKISALLASSRMSHFGRCHLYITLFFHFIVEAHPPFNSYILSGLKEQIIIILLCKHFSHAWRLSLPLGFVLCSVLIDFRIFSFFIF